MDGSVPYVFYRSHSGKDYLPIQRLYHCPTCDILLAPDDLDTELICHYCPTCLFEVPSASVKIEKARCARSCFTCDECFASLSVLALPSTSDGKTHYLSCNHCRKDSRTQGLSFARATGLGTACLEAEESAPLAREFAALRKHYEQVLMLPSLSLHARPSPRPSVSSILMARRMRQLKDLKSPVYRSPNQDDDDDSGELELAKAMTGADWNELTSMKQRLANPASQHRRKDQCQPLRTKLKAKMGKRCRDCQTWIVRPEQKTTVAKFKVAHTAIKHYPSVTIAHPLPPMTVGTTASIKLRFSNPKSEKMMYHLNWVASESSPFVQVSVPDQALTLEGKKSGAEAVSSDVVSTITSGASLDEWFFDSKGDSQGVIVRVKLLADWEQHVASPVVVGLELIPEIREDNELGQTRPGGGLTMRVGLGLATAESGLGGVMPESPVEEGHVWARPGFSHDQS